MNKTDLKQIDELLSKRLTEKFSVFKREIDERMDEVKTEMLERMNEMEMNIIGTVDKHKADKSAVEILEERVEKIEKTVYST